jgi:hypothetical protein
MGKGLRPSLFPVKYEMIKYLYFWRTKVFFILNMFFLQLPNSPDLCPRFTKEMVKAVDKLNSQSGKYKKLFAYLTEHSGMNITKITDISTLWDPLTMQVSLYSSTPKSNVITPLSKRIFLVRERV